MNETKPQGGAVTSLDAPSKDGAPGKPEAPHGSRGPQGADGPSLAGGPPFTGMPGGTAAGPSGRHSAAHPPGQGGAADKARETLCEAADEGMDRARAAARDAADTARHGFEHARSTARAAAESAREGMDRATAAVRDTADTAREAIATHGGQAMQATGRMVRDQPLTALAVTGLACFALGVLVGRGRD